MERNENGNIVTTMYYLSQHKDNAPDEYDVIRNVSEWVNAFPRDIERTPVLTKIDKEAAQTAVRVFNATERDSVVKQVSRVIDFLTDNETNKATAERVCPYPDIY